jgi:hypothetical protein
LIKPWEIWTLEVSGRRRTCAVILATEDRARLKPFVSVILCSTQRALRKPEIHEVILDQADGLDWPTLCRCDLVYAAERKDLKHRRGSVTPERRRAIAERVIRSLGLAGL